MKTVVTVHNVNPLHGEMTGIHRQLLQWMYDTADRLLIHTESGREEIGELLGVAPDRVAVIPHGDYSFFFEDGSGPLTENDGSESRKTLLFFGAIAFIPIVDALAIAFISPLIVTALSPLVLKEHVGLRRMAAVGIGFVGTLIVLRPGSCIGSCRQRGKRRRRGCEPGTDREITLAVDLRALPP